MTQPRRVSALGVAARVASERLEDVDKASGLVGYAIRGERRANRDTRLLFCTTGVLLRRLSAGGDGNLDGVSHVIVDEVSSRPSPSLSTVRLAADESICLGPRAIRRRRLLASRVEGAAQAEQEDQGRPHVGHHQPSHLHNLLWRCTTARDRRTNFPRGRPRQSHFISHPSCLAYSC